IYLNKRLLRNEQKHGLEEDEAESYNRFAELLGHMWGFITQQAEMQLKQQKEKKKADKVRKYFRIRIFWSGICERSWMGCSLPFPFKLDVSSG
ncbi:hypothetical protein ANCCAN_26960, partial [Ancylostoma caninum]